MKSTEKKEVACAPVQAQAPIVHKKETSGDDLFDLAIDKMLKKPQQHAPAK